MDEKEPSNAKIMILILRGEYVFNSGEVLNKFKPLLYGDHLSMGVTENMCGSPINEDNLYVCTRPKGHKGRHERTYWGRLGMACARW